MSLAKVRAFGRPTLAVVSALVALAGCAKHEPVSDTLVFLNERDVEGLDPHTSGEVWQTQVLLANVYETLVTFDREMAIVPSLATSWSNPDDLTWEFRLARNVTFHTGGTLTAADVVASLERAQKDPRSVLRSALANVTDVAAVADDVVRVKTREPDASLIARLREVFVVSKAALEKSGGSGLENASAGTGPYRIDRRMPGNYVDLVRFDAYRRGPAAIPKARFVARRYGQPNALSFVPPGGRLFFWCPYATPEFHAAEKEFRLYATPGPTVTYLGFDLRGSATPGVTLRGGKKGNPFLDPRVREAISLAIDPKEILKFEMGFPASQPVPPIVFGFDPTLDRAPADVEKARQLLRETPYAGGFDVDLDVRKLMDLYVPALVDALSRIGIVVHPQVHPEKAFFDKVTSGRSSLYLLRFTCRTGDAQEFFDKWAHSKDAARGLGAYNGSYDVCPLPALDSEIDAARRELVPAVRRDRLQKAMRRIASARLLVPILQNTDFRFVDKSVEWTQRADTFQFVYDMRIRKTKS